MTITALMNQPVDIIRRTISGTADEYGNTPTVEADPVETVGYLEQTDATEVLVDRETYISDWLIVLPSGTPVDSSDRIEALGRSFEIIGDPREVWNPRLQVVGQIEIRAREVNG